MRKTGLISVLLLLVATLSVASQTEEQAKSGEPARDEEWQAIDAEAQKKGDGGLSGPNPMIEVIQFFVAPAVMFTAGGLLCLAQFARFSAIVALVRTFNRERLSALQEADQAEPKRRELLLQRAQGLEHQAGSVLAHAVTVKNALRFLVGGILLMVLCSLTVGASLVFAPLGVAALALFVLGLVSTFAGLCLVLAELRVSLEVIAFEHDNLSRLRRGEGLLPPELPSSSGIDREREIE